MGGNGLTSRIRARDENAQLSVGSDVESCIAAGIFTVTRMTLCAKHALSEVDNEERR